MWMWWRKIPRATDGQYAAPARQPRAGHATAAGVGQSRAEHPRGGVGIIDATPHHAAGGRAAPGMNWRERRDMPWILLLAAAVVLIVILGVWNG
jgi:hypothetical protein